MEELQELPARARLPVAYDTTGFIQQSVDEVIKTLFEATVLVVIVIILFLQTWRAAIIPIVAIPVSLVGTFFVMQAFGFSLNKLTLFGLVLAIGIVVDDAIVVVENVERYLRKGSRRRRPRTRPWTRSAARWSRSRSCCAPCSFRPPSSKDLGRVLPAVRRDHRGLDGDLLLRLADAVAGAGRPAAAAARA